MIFELAAQLRVPAPVTVIGVKPTDADMTSFPADMVNVAEPNSPALTCTYLEFVMTNGELKVELMNLVTDELLPSDI